ncbi:hypothetical protein AB0J55_17060 [Amycolatopsis sp. NPDC049688]|uniref:hypothetical protein n=1 Tax=Amycolatopsis sp. NPDC049688 TaxID=3154733 RepID=UPI0034150E33
MRFSKTWRTAYVHGRELRRWPGQWDANFVDDDAAARYAAFLGGAPDTKLAG